MKVNRLDAFLSAMFLGVFFGLIYTGIHTLPNHLHPMKKSDLNFN